MAEEVFFVVATTNTFLYKNCTSWRTVSAVKKGDVFMVTGVPKLYNGYSMIRVCDGGALPVDFVEACTLALDVPWMELRKRMPKKVCFNRRINRNDNPNEFHVDVARQSIKKGLWRRGTWDEDMRKVLAAFDTTALALDMEATWAELNGRRLFGKYKFASRSMIINTNVKNV